MKSQDSDELAAERAREAFQRSGTLGVEEEMYLVDRYRRPTGAVEAFLRRTTGQHPVRHRLDHETFDCILETETRICRGVDDVRRDVRATRDSLLELAERYGYGIAAAGLHPVVRWQDHGCVDEERYRDLLGRFKYPQWRNTTTGLHVHVGIDDADKAVWVTNELRWYMPVVLALSANSPYYGGTDTGLQSARAKIFGNIPHTGIPPAFDSFEDFCSFERTMTETGSANGFDELWYDVRPHPGHGTVEIRAPDAQADLDRVLALVEYVAALVEDLCARYDDDESGCEIRREFLSENRWRALRHGHEASFITRDADGVVDLDTVVERESSRLGVRGIRRLLDEPSGAAMQRRLWREGGPEAVCQALCLRSEPRSGRPRRKPDAATPPKQGQRLGPHRAW